MGWPLLDGWTDRLTPKTPPHPLVLPHWHARYHPVWRVHLRTLQNLFSGVKQGCVRVPTLFGIFFSLLLRQAFATSAEGVYLHTMTDVIYSTLLNWKLKHFLIMFGDDAAVAAHSQEHQACLTISLNKTKTMGQGTVNNYTLEAVSTFTYLGSTINNNLSLNAEVSSHIGVWDSCKLTRRCRCTEPVHSAPVW